MPSGMSRKTLDQWKARLAFAHSLWSGVGLTAGRVGSKAALGANAEPIWTGLRHYRMDAWTGSWGGISKRNLATTTLGFSAYNTFAAGLLARNPKVQVLPRIRSGSQYATDIAKDAMLVEALLQYDISHQRMKRELNAALRTAFFSPLGGVIRHGFTPTQEFYASNGDVRSERLAYAEPDRPWIEAVKSWDIRIDPIAGRFDPDHSARWVAFRQLRTLDEIRSNPNLVSRKDLRSNITLGVSGGARREAELQGHPDSEWFESWVIYENTERTWFEIADGLEKPLREPADWPIPWRALPFDLLQFNPQEDTPFQVPFMAVIEKTLRERNKLRTITSELVKRLRRLIFVNYSRLAEGEEKKLTGDDLDLAEFIGVAQGADPQTVALQMQLGGLDTTLMMYDAQLLADVREALGQSQMDRAQRVNVESATEAAQIQSGSSVAHGRNEECLESFLGSVIRNYAIARQSVTDVNELLPIFGVEDTRILQDHAGADYLTVTPQQLRQEYAFDIVAGSTLQRNRQADVALVMADLQVVLSSEEMKQAVNLNQLFMDWCLARGLSPATHLLTTQQRMAVAGMQPPQMPGMEGPGQNGAQRPPPQLDQIMRVVSDMKPPGGTQ